MYHLHDSVPNIPLFAGHGTSAIYDIDQRQQVIRDAASPSARLLLSSCHETFLAELSSLSPTELSETDIDLGDFLVPESLLSLPRERHLHNPIISGSTLFLVHTIRYLAFVEAYATSSRSLTPYNDLLKLNVHHNIGILGFSSGVLPACVVGSSVTTITFISRSIEAYKLALWVGVRTHTYRERV